MGNLLLDKSPDIALKLEGYMARVLVPIADGVEEIEAVSIIDVLRRAGVEGGGSRD